MTFQIENVKLASSDADSGKGNELFARITYPFAQLEPGQCFYVEGDSKQQQRAKQAMWAHNKKKNRNLAFKNMPDGRLCIFNPVEEHERRVEQIEEHPTQFELVGWLTKQEAGFTYTFGPEFAKRFEQFGAWIKEMSEKTPRKAEWSIDGDKFTVKVVS